MTILVGLFGGLGLFLLGMQLMAEGLQKAAGDRMRGFLELFTSRTLTAIVTGAIVTALLQSSSTTTVIVVGFVNSGLMNLSQAVGTIMGANIGTTITAQIVSFDIYSFALPLIGLGALFYFFTKKKIHKYIGLAVLGFGLLLLGLSTMSGSVDPLKESERFLHLLITLGQRPFLGILTGTLFTVLIQSSSATTGLVIAFSWQGILSLEAGLALIVGANLGTCITVILSSFGTSIAAKRSALSHVLFNLFGVLFFIIFRAPFTSLVLLTGKSVARQIANAHTLFNLITTLIILPLLPNFVRLVTAIIPGEDVVIEQRPIYLEERMLGTAAALIASKREVMRMAELSLTMLKQAMDSFIVGDLGALGQIEAREVAVNSLEKEITAYLARANQFPMGEKQARYLSNLMHVVNDLERIGDHAINLTELAQVKDEKNLDLSAEAQEELENMYKVVLEICEDSYQALLHSDVHKAKVVMARDQEVDDLEKQYRANHIGRLNAGLCGPEIGVLFLDVVSNLERIADHANNIGEAVADLSFGK